MSVNPSVGDFGQMPAPQVNITIHSNENLEIKNDDGTRARKRLAAAHCGAGIAFAADINATNCDREERLRRMPFPAAAAP